jgi:hypothetical protein
MPGNALKPLLILIALVALAIMPAPHGLAQDIIKTTDSSWSANFREQLTFSLIAESSAEITETSLYYRVVGRPASSRNQAQFTPGQKISAEFKLDQTKPENYFPPGTELEFWWKLTDAAGNELKTEKQTLLYLDNRYEWQTLENERLALSWYKGGQAFGQQLFDRANVALDTLETDIGLTLERPIKIFIYGSHNDLLGAISASSQEWTGGQAFPAYGVVVIGITPGQLEWGLSATTHEMTHLVIHQATDNPYGDLPRWLDEGIAVYNENQEELDDDFRAIFERAVRANQLMTLRSLSSPFPADPMEANLAYGQSGAVVKFIVDTYGPEAMGKLLEIFGEGALYDEAMQAALGVDTDGLDNAFRTSLGLDPLPGTAAEPAPAQTAAPPAKEPSAPEPAPAATVAPTPPQAAQPEPQPDGLGLSCLAGLIPLFGLGLVLLRKTS